ncbi:hypothetical protein [Paenibacillus dendritiformis]|uniref:hypothetical protein n=1 Tax=Paenibacillus dendritiformis TaxID=130049 RepID=UPI0018CDA1DB|nr:hypothetical protein [Paenibacillus dendritiformis]
MAFIRCFLLLPSQSSCRHHGEHRHPAVQAIVTSSVANYLAMAGRGVRKRAKFASAAIAPRPTPTAPPTKMSAIGCSKSRAARNEGAEQKDAERWMRSPPICYIQLARAT